MQPSICSLLLKHNAFVINETNPFTWSSGMTMPFYCDNRVLLSFPESRKIIIDEFCQLINPHITKKTAIVGIATAGIPWASFLAAHFQLPLTYIRPVPKNHGRAKTIEGELFPDQEILLIEDLISTGKSSAKAITLLQENGFKVKYLFAIFSYGFKESHNLFKQLEIPYKTLTNFNKLQKELNTPITFNEKQKELFFD